MTEVPGQSVAAPDHRSEEPIPHQASVTMTEQYSAPSDAGVSNEPVASEASDAGLEKEPDVVFVPTPQPVVDRMLQMAKVKKSDVVYDLGSGDGRIVITAAKKYGARGYGFDVDPKRIEEARKNAEEAGVTDLVTFEQKDIFTIDLSPADVVTLYLLPELNVRLIPQLEQLKRGARIVSHDFDMRGVKPVNHVELSPPGEEKTHEIYLWIAPLRRDRV
jgi:SAM-dependent methyltransferase